MSQLARRVAKLEERVMRDPIDAHKNDARWDCDRCGQLQGLQDTVTGRIRMQYREWNVDFMPQPGEVTSVKCKRCGWMNERVRDV